MLSTEQLMKPRYKVIALWPDCDTSIGDIYIHKDGIQSEENFCNDFDPYPHLFKRLEWWEERDIRDMPEYLRIIKTAQIGKVSKWDKKDFCAHVGGYVWSVSFGAFLPATLADHTSYINSKK